MKLPKFTIGQRVKIKKMHHWAGNVNGMISTAPFVVDETSWADGYYRDVSGLNGPKWFYWLKLDAPQLDADGDGPYGEGEFAEDALSNLD